MSLVMAYFSGYWASQMLAQCVLCVVSFPYSCTVCCLIPVLMQCWNNAKTLHVDYCELHIVDTIDFRLVVHKTQY